MAEITNALSAEEWHSGKHDTPGNIVLGDPGSLTVEVERTRDLFQGHITKSLGLRIGGKGGKVGFVDGSKVHALAALCLYQQPFGFTQEDVETINDALHCHLPPGVAARLTRLNWRIQALLPPEKP